MTDEPGVIRHGDWRVEFDSANGGQIVRADWRGRPVLAPGQTGRAAADQHAGCFPLVPFSNRIRDGQFRFEGRDVILPPPEYAAPHALHGLGWRARWETAQTGPGTAQMAFTHTPGGWPWRYRADQRIDLDANRLTVTLSLTNLDTSDMPAGIGLHPYFVRPDGFWLEAATGGRWASAPGEPGLPVHREAAPPALQATGLDHCFFGWDGTVRFGGRSGLELTLSASPTLGNLVIYTPPGKPYFCAEPVSHANDVVHLEAAAPAERMVNLRPGETLSGSMRIEAELA